MRILRVSLLIVMSLRLHGQSPSLDGKEAALGRQIATEFQQRTAPIDNLAVQAFVDRLGRRIEPHLSGEKYAFTFGVFADNNCQGLHEPNAFPGGWIFIPGSLFLTAQSEADFAGMLTHAMIHVAQRHWVRQESAGRLASNGASLPLIFVGAMPGGCPDLALPAGLLAQWRRNELDTDVLAAQTMARAGFDPNALVRYIDRLQPSSDSEQRTAALRSAIERLPSGTYNIDTSEFASVQAEVRRLTLSGKRSHNPPSLLRKSPE